jgi:plasmid maintenance system antidote protein VapI
MKKKPKQKLTDQLRKAVADSGRTLGELSRDTDIDKAALSRFVNGKRFLSPEALDVIGEYLGLQVVVGKPSRKKVRQ